MKKVAQKTSGKYLTENRFKKFENSFESNMRSIAQSFSRVDESMKMQQDVLHIMLKEITAIHEDTKSFRENISTLYTDHLAYDRKIDNVIVRVEKLELKSK